MKGIKQEKRIYLSFQRFIALPHGGGEAFVRGGPPPSPTAAGVIITHCFFWNSLMITTTPVSLGQTVESATELLWQALEQVMKGKAKEYCQPSTGIGGQHVALETVCLFTSTPYSYIPCCYSLTTGSPFPRTTLHQPCLSLLQRKRKSKV